MYEVLLYVFELKVTVSTGYNVEQHRLQLEKYLKAYAFNHRVIERIAHVYFTPTGMVVVEVYCDWMFLRRKENPVTATPRSLFPAET